MTTSDRQREIIDAALVLISEQGIQELTMKRIAAIVGVSEPAIYRHFPSKSEILSALVGEIEVSRANILREARQSGAGAAETLAAFFEAHARLFAQRPAIITIFFSEDVFRNDPSLLARIAAIVKQTKTAIREEIDKGKAAGAFRRELDTEIASLMVVGGFRLLASTWRLGNYSFDILEGTRTYVRSALALLKA